MTISSNAKDAVGSKARGLTRTLTPQASNPQPREPPKQKFRRPDRIQEQKHRGERDGTACQQKHKSILYKTKIVACHTMRNCWNLCSPQHHLQKPDSLLMTGQACFLAPSGGIQLLQDLDACRVLRHLCNTSVGKQTVLSKLRFMV